MAQGMAISVVLVSATKFAGVLGVITLAANVFSFSRYRKRNLRPIISPIDESAEVLADFFSGTGNENDEKFFFGLATAPAHVEDKLSDAWLDFAVEKPCCGAVEQAEEEKPVVSPTNSTSTDDEYQKASLPEEQQENIVSKIEKPVKQAMEALVKEFEKYTNGNEEGDSNTNCDHNIAAWHNVCRPEERLRFWSDPEDELKLAKDTGVSVFRMGIDWTRIMPKEPVNNLHSSVNFAALERYRWLIERIRSYGMKVMVTLFHHSLPPWAADFGGWKSEKTVDYFFDFTRIVVDRVSELVDYWITFNEPHVFCMLTYAAGAWPGGKPDMLEAVTSTLPTGVFNQAMNLMATAHSKAYDYIHERRPNQTVGVAHHVSFTRPYGLFDVASVTLANSLTLFPYIDSISDKLDFIGMNYYGQEVFSGPGLKLVDNDEYSESGRGVYPDGLYRMLLQFQERYKHLNLPFIISENGVSDETDLIRGPYFLEHLLAVYAAMKKGVPVLGYIFWTISDNWEWADGYGPKFGLVAVDRDNHLARSPRPSYHLFSKVARAGKVTKEDRSRAWSKLKRAAREHKTRPFYRAVDRHGRMYAGGLDHPSWRPFIQRDWRFGHYEMDGLQDPFSRLWRFLLSPLRWRNKHEEEQWDEVDSRLPAAN
ncbi:glycosyl hydrolase superfamily protein [Wolffia australiana]